jgi:hypothetical protein
VLGAEPPVSLAVPRSANRQETMSRIRFAAAVAVITLLLSGCGGPSATARFAAKVNALCAGTKRQLGAIATVARTPAALLAKQAELVAKEARSATSQSPG